MRSASTFFATRRRALSFPRDCRREAFPSACWIIAKSSSAASGIPHRIFRSISAKCWSDWRNTCVSSTNCRFRSRHVQLSNANPLLRISAGQKPAPLFSRFFVSSMGPSCRKSPKRTICIPPKGLLFCLTADMCSDTLSRNSPSTMLTSSIIRTSYDLITDCLSGFGKPSQLTHLGKPKPATWWMVAPSIASAARPVGAVIPTTLPISFSSLLRISLNRTDLPVPPTPVTKTFFPSSTRSSARCCSWLSCWAWSSSITLIRARPSTISCTSCAPAPWIGEVLGEVRGAMPCAGLTLMVTTPRALRARRGVPSSETKSRVRANLSGSPKNVAFSCVGRAPRRRFRARECLASTPERTWASPARRKGFGRW